MYMKLHNDSLYIKKRFVERFDFQSKRRELNAEYFAKEIGFKIFQKMKIIGNIM